MPWHMTPDIWWNMKLKLHMKIDSGIGFEKGDFFKMDSTTMVISSPILHHHTISCRSFFLCLELFPTPSRIESLRRRYGSRWPKTIPKD